MKKLLFALLSLSSLAQAATYQSVRASTANIITPTIQTGTMNLSSGTITNLNTTTLKGATGTFTGVVTAGSFSPASALTALLASTNTWTAGQTFTRQITISSNVVDGSSLQGTAGQSFQSNAGAAPTWVNVPSAILATTSTWTASQTISSATITNLNTSTLTATNVVGRTAAATSIPIGDIGEVIISSTPVTSAKPWPAGTRSLSTATLTAGCWEIHWGFGVQSTNAGTSITEIITSISVTANTHAASSTQLNQNLSGEIYSDNVITATVPGNTATIEVQSIPTRFCITSTTPYYLIGSVGFTVSTISAFGGIYAVRVQ